MLELELLTLYETGKFIFNYRTYTFKFVNFKFHHKTVVELLNQDI